MWLLPLTAMLAGGFCAGVSLRYWLCRRHPAQLVWFMALLGISTAAACMFLGSYSGWTPLLARLYFLMAAVAFTGGVSIGTAYLLAPRAIAHIWLATVAIAALVIAVLLRGTAVDMAELAAGDIAGWRAIDSSGALPGIAAAINSIGTLVLLTGAVFGFIYKRYALACSLAALGALVLYYGGNILGTSSSYELAAIAQSAGALLVTAGVVLSRNAPLSWDD